MPRHYPRTMDRIRNTALQGEQWECGSIASHHPQTRQGDRERSICTRCADRLAAQDAAYRQGWEDAADRRELYKGWPQNRNKEYRNAVSAYEHTDTEPAISYLVGYAGGMMP